MGSFSIWHWVIVLLLILVLFGRGKVSELMGDVAKGIKSFKKGMAEDDETTPPKTLTHDPAEPIGPERAKDNAKVG
jgi:sec-independent protein translocase protein TatA